MGNIIVALPKQEDAGNICNILISRGLSVQEVCTTGASVLMTANRMDGGIVICTKQFSDMHYSRIYEYLPSHFEMLLLATPSTLQSCPVGIMSVSMPFKPSDLCSTVQLMLERRVRQQKKQKKLPKKRNETEQKYIDRAKTVLMEKNNMTEQEAFRYIQRTSMNSGTTMVEIAQMILSML